MHSTFFFFVFLLAFDFYPATQKRIWTRVYSATQKRMDLDAAVFGSAGKRRRRRVTEEKPEDGNRTMEMKGNRKVKAKVQIGEAQEQMGGAVGDESEMFGSEGGDSEKRDVACGKECDDVVRGGR
jgi:hypothetical protein